MVVIAIAYKRTPSLSKMTQLSLLVRPNICFIYNICFGYMQNDALWKWYIDIFVLIIHRFLPHTTQSLNVQSWLAYISLKFTRHNFLSFRFEKWIYYFEKYTFLLINLHINMLSTNIVHSWLKDIINDSQKHNKNITVSSFRGD